MSTQETPLCGMCVGSMKGPAAGHRAHGKASRKIVQQARREKISTGFDIIDISVHQLDAK